MYLQEEDRGECGKVEENGLGGESGRYSRVLGGEGVINYSLFLSKSIVGCVVPVGNALGYNAPCIEIYITVTLSP